MKPVVIIGMAVVCSVVAVLGILVGIQQITTYQEEYQASDRGKIEVALAKNKERCIKSFSDVIVLPGQKDPYKYCLDNGYKFTFKMLADDCVEQLSLSDPTSAIDICLEKFSALQTEAEKKFNEP